jgi:RHS repeat-associated protein
LGYYADADNGLMLLGARYYGSGVGRFWSVDPIWDGHNWYGYVYNNPTNSIDPMGLAARPKPRREPDVGPHPVFGKSTDDFGVDIWGTPQITTEPSISGTIGVNVGGQVNISPGGIGVQGGGQGGGSITLPSYWKCYRFNSMVWHYRFDFGVIIVTIRCKGIVEICRRMTANRTILEETVRVPFAQCETIIEDEWGSQTYPGIINPFN